MQLRPYQQKDIARLRTAFDAGTRRLLYVLPTGGGKTVMFAYITARMRELGNRVCILVHRTVLITQVSAALALQGVPHGIIKAGYPENPTLPVQVASVGSLVERLDRHPAFDLIITDECHHAVAGQWERILKHYNTAYQLGVTATPLRLDGKGMAGAFDLMLTGPSTADLIRHGYLSPPVVYAPSQADFSSLHVRAGDFRREESAQLMDTATIYGDAVKHYKRLANGAPAVAFCVNVALAERTAAEFTAAGVPALSIDGEMHERERARRIDALATGSIQVLTSCDLISEGFDLPGIHAAILLRPTKSLGLYLQQVGRALRLAPGKTRALILDHAGNCHRHGLPDEPREWELTADRLKRPKIALTTCMGCYAVYSAMAPACPACGTVQVSQAADRRGPQVKAAVELERVDASNPWARLPYKEAIRRARSEEQLKELAAARGYKPGWVRKMLQLRGDRA